MRDEGTKNRYGQLYQLTYEPQYRSAHRWVDRATVAIGTLAVEEEMFLDNGSAVCGTDVAAINALELWKRPVRGDIV